MEHFGMSLTSDWLTFITHWNCFWISFSFSPFPYSSLLFLLSSLFPFFPPHCFRLLLSLCSFGKPFQFFPLLIFSWDVDGMLMLTWSSVATFLVNFDCRFWTKTHLISLKNAHGPHVILLLFWMLLRGRLTCLFSLSPMLLLSFASDVVVSF